MFNFIRGELNNFSRINIFSPLALINKIFYEIIKNFLIFPEMHQIILFPI